MKSSILLSFYYYYYFYLSKIKTSIIIPIVDTFTKLLLIETKEKSLIELEGIKKRQYIEDKIPVAQAVSWVVQLQRMRQIH